MSSYFERIITSNVMLFGSTPIIRHLSPLKKGDYTERDDSEFLDDEMQQYQSMRVGSLLDCLDITTAVMTVSSLPAMPRHVWPR